MFQKSVKDVLKGADKFISELEAASAYEAQKAQEKANEVAKLQVQVQELDASAKQGKVVAERFRKLLEVE